MVRVVKKLGSKEHAKVGLCYIYQLSVDLFAVMCQRGTRQLMPKMITFPVLCHLILPVHSEFLYLSGSL